MSSVPKPDAKPPIGRGVIWMRRIAKAGFAISVLYFIYLVAIIFVSMKLNSEFEGEAIGNVAIEMYGEGDSKTVPAESTLLQTPLFDPSVPQKKVVVLWATWCGPCHSLLMDLKEEVLAGRLPRENIVAVSMVEPLKDVAAYLQEWPLPFPVALDRKGELAKRVKLQGTPTVMFLDENGIIKKLTTGGFGLSGKIVDFANAK